MCHVDISTMQWLALRRWHSAPRWHVAADAATLADDHVVLCVPSSDTFDRIDSAPHGLSGAAIQRHPRAQRIRTDTLRGNKFPEGCADLSFGSFRERGHSRDFVLAVTAANGRSWLWKNTSRSNTLSISMGSCSQRHVPPQSQLHFI